MIIINNSLTFNGKELTLGGKGMTYSNYYTVYTSVLGDGTMTATPTSGETGTIITLSNTPGQHSTFDHYTLHSGTEEITLSGTNTFTLYDNDVTAVANFEVIPPYNLTLHVNGEGTVSASKMTGYENDEVHIAATASADHFLNGYDITGAELYGYDDKYFVFGDKDVSITANFEHTDPLNPLNLPDYTMRLKYYPNTAPVRAGFVYGTFNQVSTNPNIWDYHCESSYWGGVFAQDYNLIEVMGANLKDITGLNTTFRAATSLSSVALFDTKNIRNMGLLFHTNYSLSSVPLFNTENVSSMDGTFWWSNLTSVPLFNTKNVKTMAHFLDGTNLTSVPKFNTSAVRNFDNMLYALVRLTAIPNFDVRNARRVDYMFGGTINVKNGISAMYSALSSLGNQITSHSGTFYECGSNTTASAQLALIPSDWK